VEESSLEPLEGASLVPVVESSRGRLVSTDRAAASPGSSRKWWSPLRRHRKVWVAGLSSACSADTAASWTLLFVYAAPAAGGCWLRASIAGGYQSSLQSS